MSSNKSSRFTLISSSVTCAACQKPISHQVAYGAPAEDDAHPGAWTHWECTSDDDRRSMSAVAMAQGFEDLDSPSRTNVLDGVAEAQFAGMTSLWVDGGDDASDSSMSEAMAMSLTPLAGDLFSSMRLLGVDHNKALKRTPERRAVVLRPGIKRQREPSSSPHAASSPPQSSSNSVPRRIAGRTKRVRVNSPLPAQRASKLSKPHFSPRHKKTIPVSGKVSSPTGSRSKNSADALASRRQTTAALGDAASASAGSSSSTGTDHHLNHAEVAALARCIELENIKVPALTLQPRAGPSAKSQDRHKYDGGSDATRTFGAGGVFQAQGGRNTKAIFATLIANDCEARGIGSDLSTLILSQNDAVEDWDAELAGESKLAVQIDLEHTADPDIRSDVVLTTADVFLGRPDMRARAWKRIIVDDGAALADSKDPLSWAVRRIEAECRWILSPTRLDLSVHEWRSIFVALHLFPNMSEKGVEMKKTRELDVDSVLAKIML